MSVKHAMLMPAHVRGFMGIISCRCTAMVNTVTRDPGMSPKDLKQEEVLCPAHLKPVLPSTLSQLILFCKHTTHRVTVHVVLVGVASVALKRTSIKQQTELAGTAAELHSSMFLRRHEVVGKTGIVSYFST